VLGRVPLFAELSQRDLKRIAGLADEVWLPPGHQVIEEGKPALAFYVILDGSARVVRGTRKRVLRHLGPGDYFGEMSLIDGSPRSASVVAESTLDVIRLKRSAFRRVLQTEPDVAFRIMTGLAARVRNLERDLLG
jgi:CRP/FNR family cyclic AMP-dependent transcriptional regulator